MEIIAVGAGVVAAGIYLVDRDEMKKRDEEIAAQRKRERAVEANRNQNRKPKPELLLHFSHTHPLSEFYFDSSRFCGTCGVCDLPINTGWVYFCSPCGYLLHEVCAKDLVSLTVCSFSLAREIRAPVGSATLDTFAHAEHLVKEMYSNKRYRCRHCFTPGYGNRFRCDGCELDFHPVCATCPTKISSFMHPQHELELKTRPHFSRCDICNCQIGSNIRFYRCKPCEFYVHPACSQLPQHLMHDLHPPHPLQLRLGKHTRSCDARCGSHCLKKRWGYECKTCNITIHISCILQTSAHGTPHHKKDINEIIQVLKLVVQAVKVSNGLITAE